MVGLYLGEVELFDQLSAVEDHGRLLFIALQTWLLPGLLVNYNILRGLFLHYRNNSYYPCLTILFHLFSVKISAEILFI